MNILDTVEPGRCYLIDELPGRPQARKLSEEWSCSLWLGQGHVTRGNGNKPGTVYLVAHLAPELLAARAAVQELTGAADPGFTFPSLARHVTEWTGIRNDPQERAKQLLKRVWHYQEVTPCRSSSARMYDLTAAYWQFASRAKSPIFDITEKGIAWKVLSPAQESRWELVKMRFKAHKKLRLAIIGCNSVGAREGCGHGRLEVFRAGSCLPQPGRAPAPLQPLAAVSIRSTLEVTQVQAGLSDALYANVDCNITESTGLPAYWEHLGLEYGMKCAGRTEIRAVGAWRCGDKMTDTFPWFRSLDHWQPFHSGRVNPVWHARLLSTSLDIPAKLLYAD